MILKSFSGQKWEVSLTEFDSEVGKNWKVTRRNPHMIVADTRMFNNKQEADELYWSWYKKSKR
jgi:hypothetical protein